MVLQPIPMLNAPSARIEGLPAVVKHDLLDNRREVLVQDTAEDVYVLDVTCGRKTRRCASRRADAVDS